MYSVSAKLAQKKNVLKKVEQYPIFHIKTPLSAAAHTFLRFFFSRTKQRSFPNLKDFCDFWCFWCFFACSQLSKKKVRRGEGIISLEQVTIGKLLLILIV